MSHIVCMTLSTINRVLYSQYHDFRNLPGDMRHNRCMKSAMKKQTLRGNSHWRGEVSSIQLTTRRRKHQNARWHRIRWRYRSIATCSANPVTMFLRTRISKETILGNFPVSRSSHSSHEGLPHLRPRGQKHLLLRV